VQGLPGRMREVRSWHQQPVPPASCRRARNPQPSNLPEGLLSPAAIWAYHSWAHDAVGLSTSVYGAAPDFFTGRHHLLGLTRAPRRAPTGRCQDLKPP
jgi:hypothetical protein